MPNKNSENYLEIVSKMSRVELETEIQRPAKLLMEAATIKGKSLSVAYAPFDFVNADAKIVIVGITPGRQQMENALKKAQQILLCGGSKSEALEGAKVFASFSGPMRNNLVAMLDHVGIAEKFGIRSTSELFNDRSDLVHFTSALRYPVFVDNQNYSNQPNMCRTPFLTEYLETYLLEEMKLLNSAIFVPLGSKVEEALYKIAPLAGVSENQILGGLAHPSGANNERINYFIGRKPANELSVKTNAASIDAAKNSIIIKVANLEISDV